MFEHNSIHTPWIVIEISKSLSVNIVVTVPAVSVPFVSSTEGICTFTVAATIIIDKTIMRILKCRFSVHTSKPHNMSYHKWQYDMRVADLSWILDGQM
jgi:hypothetical protein